MKSELVVKEVEFNGATLMATKLEDGSVYVGVRWVCEGIGLSEGQIKAERKKIQDDLVLKQGGRNLVLPTDGGNQEVLCVNIKTLPLWLAKISITPKMQKEKPVVTQNLIDYQLKAQDVLAKAFVEKQPFILPTSYEEALEELLVNLKEKKALSNIIEEQKPMVDFHNDVTESEGVDDFLSVSKSLGVGRNKLMALLRASGILFLINECNVPKQLYQDQGYFEVVMTIKKTGAVTNTSYRTTVTGKGVTWLHKIVSKYGGADVINKMRLDDIEEHVKNIKENKAV